MDTQPRPTPKTDALRDLYENHEYRATVGDIWELCEFFEREFNEAREQRDRLAEKFTRLDKPKYSGDPMLDSVLKVTNPAFRNWAHSLPPTYWARYDLSAARIGWEAACDKALRSKCNSPSEDAGKAMADLIRQRDEARGQRDRLAKALSECREDSIELLDTRGWWQHEPRGDYQQRYQETRHNVRRADAALQSLTTNEP